MVVHRLNASVLVPKAFRRPFRMTVIAEAELLGY